MSRLCSRQIVPESRPHRRKYKNPVIPAYCEVKEWNMTPRQQQILDFIKQFIAENEYPPTNLEIRQHTGLSSSSTVCLHLQALRFLGKIAYADRRFRSIVVVPDVDPVDRLAASILEHCNVALVRDELAEAMRAAGVRL